MPDFITVDVNGVYHQVESCNVLVRDRVMVEWVELGEGWNGDYNPDDPTDEELLRFDVSWLDDNGEWIDPGDVSYCTRTPVKTTAEQRRALLEIIMDAVHDALDSNGYGGKKICEELSWIGLDWLPKEAK